MIRSIVLRQRVKRQSVKCRLLREIGNFRSFLGKKKFEKMKKKYWGFWCHLLQMCTKSHNYMMYGSWDRKWDIILLFWAIFRSFIPLPTQKIKILKYWKKRLEILIILQMCTINEDHTMYGSCDMIEVDGQNLQSFWTIFSLFSLLTTRKIKILKIWKKKTPGHIIILQICTINDNYIMYGSWDRSATARMFCHFGPCFYPLLS